VHHETITNKADGTPKTYYIIRPKGRPMVLFSKEDNTPLVAITLRARSNNHKRERVAVIAAPNSDFYGYFKNMNQGYELVLTNLTDLGEIKVDISTINKAVDCIDPGIKKQSTTDYINRVNELYPFQSYPIRNHQKSLQLLSLKKITDYYISVTPRSDILELTKKFQETYWDCVDFLCIHTSKERIAQIYSRQDSEEETTTGLTYQYDVSTNIDQHLCRFRLNIYRPVVQIAGRHSKRQSYPKRTCPQISKRKMTRVEVIEVGKAMIHEHLMESLPSSQIYLSKECVICLDENPIPDAILHPCGHQCAHRSCMKDLEQCPICRAPIEKIL
jgi:hypothetical protein